MSRHKKRFFPEPDIPLAVPTVDNHTHISPDPVPTEDVRREDAAFGGDGESGQGASKSAADSAGLCPPLAVDTLRSMMRRCGVRAAVTSGCEIPAYGFTLDLARRYPEFWAALAVHPNEAALHAGVSEISPDGMTHALQEHHRRYSLEEAISLTAGLCADRNVVAVGETGLDYFRTGEAGAAAQKESFRAHLALAKELDKPLQIHDRDAHSDVVEILLKDGAPRRTVFHCFSGDVTLAEICAEHGWYASFSGNLTYKANTDLRRALQALPAHLILAETDAPYLTPEPYRGHPNAVWAVAYTVRFQARLRNMDTDRWCGVLNQNVSRVYGI